jgi:hypothetical protein
MPEVTLYFTHSPKKRINTNSNTFGNFILPVKYHLPVPFPVKITKFNVSANGIYKKWN